MTSCLNKYGGSGIGWYQSQFGGLGRGSVLNWRAVKQESGRIKIISDLQLKQRTEKRNSLSGMKYYSSGTL